MPARLKLFLPLVVFFGLALLLFRGLQLDPRELPSALIDQPFPAFSLPSLASGETLNVEALRGEVALYNIWATWCYTCRVEHPYLLKLAQQGVPIYGVNYKDEPEAARRWLAELGDPYRDNIVDQKGTLGLDLGVTGAPETYLVDKRGVIRYRHVGEVNERVWKGTLEPLYDELLREDS